MYTFLLTNRRIILFVSLIGIVAGFFSLQKMPIKMYPDINKPTVYVGLSHPSYTAVDFSDSYGSLIENKIASIEDVDTAEIRISNRRTQIVITFDYGIDAEEARKRVQTAFDSLKNSLPEETKDYGIGWNEETLNELDITLYSTEFDEKMLYDIARPVILDYLEKIPDADEVYVMPVENLRATLTLRPDALFSYGLTVDSVVNAVKSGYKNTSIGSLRTDSGMVSLRIRKNIDSVYDIERIRIADVGGKTVQLKDVADISIEYGLPWATFQINGNRSVAVMIRPKADGNLMALSKDVRKAMNEALAELPGHVGYEIVIDPATFIEKSIRNVVQSAIIGALLAFFCIILLIGEIRNSLIIGISIPMSVIFSFILMYVFGVTINLISLSGLALAVGMIVDASIVTMENIYRHREEELEKNGSISDYVALVGSATKEITPSIIGSTITSICVFMPLSFTSPLTANILGDIALTVIFTLTCSLLVALFVIPLIAFYVYRTKKPPRTDRKQPLLKRFSTALTDTLIRAYQKLLLVFLNSKTASILFIILSAAALVFCLAFLAPKITREIIATPQGNIVTMYIRNSTITDQTELVAAIAPLEADILTNYPGIVKTVFSNISDRSANLMIELYSSSQVPRFIDDLTKKYQDDNNWTYSIGSWDPSAMPLPETYALQIRVEGPDRGEKLALMDRIVDVISKSELYGWTRTVPGTALSTEIAMYARDEAFAAIPEYTQGRLATLIQYLLNGANVITIQIDDNERTLTLRYPQGTVSSVKDVEDYQLPYDGKSIPLKHFFDFEETTGITELSFKDGKEVYTVYATLGMDTPSWKQAEYEAQIKKAVEEQIELPQGYRIVFEDTQKVINEAVS